MGLIYFLVICVPVDLTLTYEYLRLKCNIILWCVQHCTVDIYIYTVYCMYSLQCTKTFRIHNDSQVAKELDM